MKKVLFLLGALFSFNAFAANLEEGKQYVQVSQTASAQPEVIEFFSFYCPHCYAFEMEYHIPKQVAEGLPQGTEFKNINSFAVNGLVNKQVNAAEQFQVRGVPDFYVNGKYRVNPEGLNYDDFVKDYVETVKGLLQK
ncbi:MAG: DsbA family protein [Haemophilus parainfluenzae]|nr:DsbA family protein [Haemophilus parainfluenzae]